MPLNEIAELLERHHIKRVPVLSDGRLAGIVSRANLLHGLANTIVEHHEPGAAKDRQLRRELMKILLDEHKLDTVFVNVTVHDGNVRLWGVVENADEAAAAEGAAKTLPGVKSVKNNLGPGQMSGVPVLVKRGARSPPSRRSLSETGQCHILPSPEACVVRHRGRDNPTSSRDRVAGVRTRWRLAAPWRIS
jgi:hypothetical protein